MSTWSEVRSAMVVATACTSAACARRVESGELVRVFRNVFVPASLLAEPDRWERARTVNLVRACAVALVLGSEAVLSHETAALLHGAPTEREFLDVHVCIGRRWGGASHMLPELRLPGGQMAPPVRLVRHESTPGRDDALRDGPVALVPPVVAAVQCAHSLHPREGVVVVSGLLRMLSGFDRFRQEDSRRREEQWRARMVQSAQGYPAGTRNSRRARAVIAAADAGCESAAEAALVWALKTAGFTGVRTQVLHCVGPNEYYVDVEVDATGVGLEFDGTLKYGENTDQVRTALRRQNRRQKDLESQGLVVLRIEYRELADWEGIRDQVCARSRTPTRPRPNRRLLP